MILPPKPWPGPEIIIPPPGTIDGETGMEVVRIEIDKHGFTRFLRPVPPPAIMDKWMLVGGDDK